jgi:hypothetical protein
MGYMHGRLTGMSGYGVTIAYRLRIVVIKPTLSSLVDGLICLQMILGVDFDTELTAAEPYNLTAIALDLKS